MTNRNAYAITSKQLIFILIGTMLGTGIISLPRLVAKDVGQDAWIGVLLGALLPLASVTLIQMVCNKYQDKAFLPLLEELLGKYLSRLFAFIFAIYSFLAAAILLRVFTEIISMFLIPLTPLLVKICLMLFVCAYLACQDAKILGRVYEFLFYVLFPLLLFILPAVFKHACFLNMLPIMNHKLSELAKAALSTSFAYSGFETYIIYYAFVVKKDQAYKASLYAVGITTLIYLYFVLSTISVFGAELTQQFTWPFLRLVATADVPAIERMEFLFLQAWVGVAFRPISSQYFCSSYIIAEIFKFKAQKTAVFILFPIIAFIAWFPKDIYQLFKLSEKVGYFSLIVGLILPLLLLIISLFKSKKEADSVETQ